MSMNFLSGAFTQATERLLIRRPRPGDAEQVFRQYASDPEVTRYLAWPTHRSLADTKAFLRLADEHWEYRDIGPLLVFDRATGALLGGSGIDFGEDGVASTGYVLARSAWGRGYATETLRAVLGIAHGLGLTRVTALCHPDHRASIRVLEKCGFQGGNRLLRHTEFPNLGPGELSDVLHFEVSP